MATPLILLAHGAGAPSSSPWMLRWAERLAPLGRVQRFDYPYMVEGRKSPDPLPRLIAAHRQALRDARATGPVVLAGKSMGSRVGCHLSLGEDVVDALVCFGYPLRGANGKVREEVLLQLRKPILFVAGTRDALCPLDLLEQVRARMQVQSSLHVVDSGNHSLQVTKRSGIDQDQADVQVFEAIRAFLSEVVLP